MRLESHVFLCSQTIYVAPENVHKMNADILQTFQVMHAPCVQCWFHQNEIPTAAFLKPLNRHIKSVFLKRPSYTWVQSLSLHEAALASDSLVYHKDRWARQYSLATTNRQGWNESTDIFHWKRMGYTGKWLLWIPFFFYMLHSLWNGRCSDVVYDSTAEMSFLVSVGFS